MGSGQRQFGEVKNKKGVELEDVVRVVNFREFLLPAVTEAYL